MSSERRTTGSRVNYLCEAQIEGIRNTWDTVRVSDLGPGGAFLDTRQTLAVGSRTRVTFTVEKTDIVVAVEVVYVLPSIGVGVRFLDLSPESLARIELLKRKPSR